LEAGVKASGFKIPDALLPVHIMSRMGWDFTTYRATPKHVIDDLLLLWHLENLQAKKQNAEASAGKK
jgi:hypothetical protein